MASSAPVTPKGNFVTPRKIGSIKTTGISENGTFTAPNTPRTQYVTPRKSQKLPVAPDTPECFNSVTMETPNSASKHVSKEKFDEISNLIVAVRIRPMNNRELSYAGVTDVVRVRDKDLIIKVESTNNSMSVDHIFQYDHIFWSCDEENPLYSTQEDVFLTIGKPLLNSAFRGYNGCLFAYGQTGSGKSFSMMGRNTCEIVDIDSVEFAGLTPRFCRDLFTRIKSLENSCTASVGVSYFEIYNEKIHDLLSSQSNSNKTPLKVREHPVWGPYVVDLSVYSVQSYKELRNWLLLGNKNRATAATSMNEKSSRSHSIFSIELCLSDISAESDSSKRSRISLVDLAGSERLGNSHNSEEKIKQGVSINKSLLTLGKVISSLADQKKNQFVPYRDSVLTWLLRESLGGNSLTSMLATITPASTHLEETLATLRYACQARSIINRARVNENPHDKVIRELRSEVERLKALRQDYERSSLSSSIQLSDSNSEELEELRSKLSSTEQRLQEAQKHWERKLIESKKSQMKELAEAEKYKLELESKVRIMKTADKDVNLSPFKSNFLQELEGVLTEDPNEICNSDIMDDIKEWCCKNNLICTYTSDSFIICDQVNKKQAILLLDGKTNLNGYENISDFVKNLSWTNIKQHPTKLTKSEVMASMNQVYKALSSLQPPDSENDLNLLFAKVNKALQSFEAALLNSVNSKNAQKIVSFKV